MRWDWILGPVDHSAATLVLVSPPQAIGMEIHTHWPFSSPPTLLSELTGSLRPSRVLGALLLSRLGLFPGACQ